MSGPMTPRQRHVFAVEFLLSGRHPAALKDPDNREQLQAVLDFVRNDVPDDLAMTDPCLYRKLRNRITELKLSGIGLRTSSWRKIAMQQAQTEDRPDDDLSPSN